MNNLPLKDDSLLNVKTISYEDKKAIEYNA